MERLVQLFTLIARDPADNRREPVIWIDTTERGAERAVACEKIARGLEQPADALVMGRGLAGGQARRNDDAKGEVFGGGRVAIARARTAGAAGERREGDDEREEKQGGTEHAPA